MVVDSETGDNPYSSSSTPATLSGRSWILRWLLLGGAVFLVMLSLPIAWRTLELANQEYLHIWRSRSVIHDIQMNGKSISIVAVISNGALAVLVQWSLAVTLIVGARLLPK